MNRRGLFKGIFGVAVASQLPKLPAAAPVTATEIRGLQEVASLRYTVRTGLPTATWRKLYTTADRAAVVAAYEQSNEMLADLPWVEGSLQNPAGKHS